MDQKLEITALVLAGGKSTRMGRDKASLCLYGKTLLERVLEAVASLCREVVLVTAQGQRLGCPLDTPLSPSWTGTRREGPWGDYTPVLRPPRTPTVW